jgi:hypothetical protein
MEQTFVEVIVPTFAIMPFEVGQLGRGGQALYNPGASFRIALGRLPFKLDVRKLDGRRTACLPGKS